MVLLAHTAQGTRFALELRSYPNLDVTVQVFEVTIRVLGGLLSAHLFAINPALNLTPPGYSNELLVLGTPACTE